MSSNSKARQSLEKVFGKKCMIETLGIRYIPRKRRMKIKGYTKYDDVITFHHIKEKHNGGKATFENGALVKGYNHRWLHTLPENKKQEVNDCLLEFKAAFLAVNGEGNITMEPALDIQLDHNFKDCIEIPLLDNKQLDIKPKKPKYNRAKVNREYDRLAQEDIAIYEDIQRDLDEER